MNNTRKDTNQQSISIKCSEERLAALIADAKSSFNGIFAALKNELVHYLLFSERELLAGLGCQKSAVLSRFLAKILKQGFFQKNIFYIISPI